MGTRWLPRGVSPSRRGLENGLVRTRTDTYVPFDTRRLWKKRIGLADSIGSDTTVLDPTAGGGAVPFEAMRLGFITTYANDLNPVAALIGRATVEWPATLLGPEIRKPFLELGTRLVNEIRRRLVGVFPDEPLDDVRPDGYVWAHTVRCPYCNGVVPLSPNWRLTPDGTGVKLQPHLGDGLGSDDRRCEFQIVESANEQSAGTVSRGNANCPYPDCGRVVDGDEIKLQAREGEMGHQLYAVVCKKRVRKMLKSGKRGKDRWVRGYRAPCPSDDNGDEIERLLAEKLPEWEALDIVPSERIPDGNKTTEPLRYGCLTGETCSPHASCCATVPASRSSARCFWPTRTSEGLPSSARRHTDTWR